MEVGFIGLGAMGLPMARNLLKAGHTVHAWNRTRRRTEELAAEGARLADSPADAARAGIVITMLADDGALEDVLIGKHNLLAQLPSGAVHISMSTISVALSRRLAEAHSRSGSVFVSAPVFGRPEAAAAAKLFVVAAGPPEAIKRLQPLFDSIGQRTFTFGADPASANAVKLAGNFLIASMLESLGEAFALAGKSGVEPRQFLDFITNSLFDVPIYKNYGRLIAEQKFQPAGFKVPLGLKDVRLVLAAAESAMVPMPVANVVRDHLLTALARGRQDWDWSSLAQVVAEDAGI